MAGKVIFNFLILAYVALGYQVIQPGVSSTKSSLVDKDDGKSSLVFVFDVTGSMYNDLRQLREGAEMILKTALEEGNVIADFVFVPFHDPAVGPATVTKNKTVLKAALNIVRVYGGGDCPEKSLGGIQLGLNLSRPRSYIYVFTDATASDHRLVGNVLDSIQRKQSQVVFVLTGHCNDLHRPSYKVYQQIAAASSGQVFHLNKTNVHMVLDFVRSSIKGRSVNLATAVRPAGYNYTQGIRVDKMIDEVTVSVAGAKPQIEVVDPSGVRLTGPPKLVTTLDLSEIMIVKVLNPEPGNWSITVGSEKDYSVKVVGLSDLTFNHGFSVEKPSTMAETSYRPLKGTYNNMMISLSKNVPVKIDYAEILGLDGKTIFEVPLKEVDSEKKVYLADVFVPPDEFFYIAINGHDVNGQEFRRIASTAVQSKLPEAPYLTAPQKVNARQNERVVLTCGVDSLVPVTATWTKDTLRIQEQINSLQSTTVDYVIDSMDESHVGTYRCVARNVAGISKAITHLELVVKPPNVTIAPVNSTIPIDKQLIVSCSVFSESPLTKSQIIFSSIERQNLTEFHLKASPDGFYSFNKTIQHVTERSGGQYMCMAANRGGQTKDSTYITIQVQPVVQILGPHSLTKRLNSDFQLVCHVENSDRMQWLGPDNAVVSESDVNSTYNAMLDVKNVTSDGTWTCVALRKSYRATDSILLTVLIKPRVKIDGNKNITVLNGTSHQVTCMVTAKPAPRILWHRETEAFLDHTVTVLENNTFRSVLTLNSEKEEVNGTYFCFGENSEGIDQDSVIVSVRRKMVVLEGFTDQSVELLSQIDLHCRIDSYPEAKITWLHNGTAISFDDNINISEDLTVMYIRKVDFGNLGMYTCSADNGYESMQINGSLTVHGLESPVLSKEPSKKKNKKGESAILTCRVLKGNPKPTVTWEFKRDSSDNFTRLPIAVLVHEDRNEIEIPELGVEHAGSYRCVATNVVGQDAYVLDLVVQSPPKLISSEESHHEEPMEVKGGEKIVLSCKAEGLPPPITTWTKFDQPIAFSQNVYLTDKNELVIEKASEYNSGVYTCKTSNVLGSVERNFTLVVYVPPKIASPGIESDVNVLEGQLVELPCDAQGVPAPAVAWLHNGELIESGRIYMDEYGLRFVANLTDFGEYTCHASNQYGNTSLSYTIYVWVPPHIEGPMESYKNVMIGSNSTLTCDAVGFPIPTIMWEFQGQLLKENTSSVQFNSVGNLYIVNVSLEHSGVYACVAENMVGVDQKFIMLSVHDPPKILNENYTGPFLATNMDTVLSIPCRATGVPRPFVIWSKDDHFLNSDSRYKIDMDGTLSIMSPSEEFSGEYTCVAKNSAGNSSKTVQVEIYSVFTEMQGEEAQSSVTLVEGTSSTVECPVRPSDNVKWYKDAVLISNGTLTFTNVSRSNASAYACVVTNAVASAYASVSINVQWAPSFVENVAKDVEVVKGNDWYFDCRVDAKPKAKVKWYFNSKLMLGEDRNVLKLFSIELRHTGTYKCVATNDHGTVFRQFTLDVLVPPNISEFDVLDVELKKGSGATLDCSAKGSPTPQVEWIFNNTCWTRTNDTLVSAPVTDACSGLYRCEARNSAGAAHLVYRVTVISPAAVKDVVVFRDGEGVVVDGSLEVPLGASVRVACQATGNPDPTIQWSKLGNIISENGEGIRYADLDIKSVETSHSGLYSCVASNGGGMDERKIRIVVLEPPRIFQELFQNANSSDSEVNLEVISGQPFYLHCHPYGNPFPEVYWFKDDVPLRFFDESMVSKDYGETVVVSKARYEQSGNYTCVARNKVGNTSVVYLVDVLVAPPQLKDSSRHVTTHVNEQLNLTCPAEGHPLPYVTWVKHPYEEISDQTPGVVLVNENYTMIINKTEVSDSGKYSCVMTNKIGTTEVVFEVMVEKAPSIVGNKANGVSERHLVPLRRNIVLKCEVDGHPTPKISWLKDTQELSDSDSSVHQVPGTSSLAVWRTRVRDAGQYICVAENPAGVTHRRYDVVVKVPGKWSPWSRWGYCNETCGLGYQARTRFCHYIDDDNNTIDKSSKSDKIVLDESSCKGSVTDRRKCHMPACEEATSHWSGWSRWSGCSATCGTGTQSRSRRCRGPEATGCIGDNMQIRKCPNLPKCEYSENTDNNEVLNSRENRETQNYLPEATFETQPEIVESHRTTDVEDFYANPVMVSPLYYDVNVTNNLDHSDPGFCEPGYRPNSADGTCNDIDECTLETNNCHATQVCANTAGGYRCACAAGYVSLGAGQRCLDVNECLTGAARCGARAACVNVAGGYVCACARPLRLHVDRRHCVPPSEYRKPLSYEDSHEDIISASFEYPARYTQLPRH